jgi:hypothetical protein
MEVGMKSQWFLHSLMDACLLSLSILIATAASADAQARKIALVIGNAS